jgi:hypothetical protein
VLPLAREARQFFLTGEPELADRYFPWLALMLAKARASDAPPLSSTIL